MKFEIRSYTKLRTLYRREVPGMGQRGGPSHNRLVAMVDAVMAQKLFARRQNSRGRAHHAS
jgi:hypothetical protein